MKPLLDYTSSFEDDQIRKIFTFFAALDIVSELVIIIRKQLSNVELQYKRVGIIGAVALCACYMAATPLVSNKQDEVHELTNMAIKECEHDVAAKALLVDELYVTVANTPLSTASITWLNDKFDNR